jgi:uncharacterized phiE125 gp8 family phage protein
MRSLKPVTNIPNLGLNITVATPATAMLTAAEAKTHTRIDFSEDDTLVDSFILSATLWVQKLLNRALITQTVIAEWSSVGYDVPLPYAPVSSITTVQTVSDDGTLTALTLNSGYHVRNGIIKVQTSLGLRVTYQAGYGAASTDVPAPIKTAIKRLVNNMYDRRDDEVFETNIDQISFGTSALLHPYLNERI